MRDLRRSTLRCEIRSTAVLSMIPFLAACYSSFGPADAHDATPVDPIDTSGWDTRIDPDVDPDPPYEPWPDPGHDPGCYSVTGGVCSVIEQCGCSPGFFCEFFIDSSTCLIIEDCQAGSGDLPVEAECRGIGQCQPGTTCVGASVLEFGHCMEWCRDSSDCSVAGRECNVPMIVTVSPCPTITMPYLLCSLGCPVDAGCDLWATGGVTGCAAGFMCIRDDPIASGGCDVSLCGPAGTGALGDECVDGDLGCLPGTGCYGNHTDGYYCRAYCDSSRACTSGTCTVLGSESWPDLGICIW